jgi:putative DNA primase/helicase
VFRFVDARKPTLIIDEADDLFVRKSDLKHIINASWTRGFKIPRQVNINGVSVTVFFDPFCPKIVGLLGRNLPRALKTRAIEIRMMPKRPDEKVEPFGHVDDFEFAVLRRKLTRWAIDNAETLKSLQPTFPVGMNNRAAVNWKLSLGIAELAGDVKKAREAAERLTSGGRRPSDGVRLLTVIKDIFAHTGKSEVTSEALVIELCKDPHDVWVTFNKGGQITQRQIGLLLDAYDIHPSSLHPTKSRDFSRQGYKISQFTDAFARYVLHDPIIQSPVKPKPKKRG